MSTTRAVRTILWLDVRAIRRDHVAVGTIILSALGTVVIAVLGVFQDRLPGWSSWFPFMVAASLVGAPAGFAFPFGLLMVDEGDTGVRDALAVTPVRPAVFFAARTVMATAWMAVWPLTAVYVMNATWRAVDLPLAHWLAVAGPLALFTPAFVLLVPALARDKVGALAVLKGLSFLCLIPLALFLVPADAWYRPVFLFSPTGWFVEAFQAFLGDDSGTGYSRAQGGMVYAMLLLALVAAGFRKKVYR